MELEYHAPSPVAGAERWRRPLVVCLMALMGYFVLSSITIPFVDEWWVGELPVLALVQQPKVELAGWVRTDVVMPLIRALGWSSGSYSPDYIAARAWGLAIAYVVPLLLIVALVVARTRLSRPFGWLMLALLALAAADFVMTLVFADGPSLTIY